MDKQAVHIFKSIIRRSKDHMWYVRSKVRKKIFLNTQLKLLIFYIIGIMFTYILVVKLLRHLNFYQKTSTYFFFKSCHTMNSKIKLFILIALYELETIGRLCISGLCHRRMPQK